MTYHDEIWSRSRRRWRIDIAFCLFMVPALAAAQDPPTADNVPLSNESLDFRDDDVSLPDVLIGDSDFQKGLKCGPNAAFIVARRRRVKVDYDEVLRSIEIGQRGASVEDVARCLRNLGIPAEVRKNVTPEDLLRISGSTVVHLSAVDRRSSDAGAVDHFTVLTGTVDGGSSFTAIDTTSMLPTVYRTDYLARNMSGYAIVTADAVDSGSLTPWLKRAALAVAAVVAVAVGSTAKRRIGG